MGLPGLKALLLQNPTLMKNVNLCDTKLVVDTSSVTFLMFRELGQPYGPRHRNDVYGGDMVAFAHLIRAYFDAFRACNIQPIFVLDGTTISRLPSIYAGFCSDNNAPGEIRRKSNCRTQELPPPYREMPKPKKCDDMSLMRRTQILELARLVIFNLLLTEYRDFERYQAPVDALDHLVRLAKEHDCYVLTGDTALFLFNLPKGILFFEEIQFSSPMIVSNQCIPCCVANAKFIMHSAHFPGLTLELLRLIDVMMDSDFFETDTFQHAMQQTSNLDELSESTTTLTLEGVQEREIARLLTWLGDCGTIDNCLERMTKALEDLHPNCGVTTRKLRTHFNDLLPLYNRIALPRDLFEQIEEEFGNGDQEVVEYLRRISKEYILPLSVISIIFGDFESTYQDQPQSLSLRRRPLGVMMTLLRKSCHEVPQSISTFIKCSYATNNSTSSQIEWSSSQDCMRGYKESSKEQEKDNKTQNKMKQLQSLHDEPQPGPSGLQGLTSKSPRSQSEQFEGRLEPEQKSNEFQSVQKMLESPSTTKKQHKQKSQSKKHSETKHNVSRSDYESNLLERTKEATNSKSSGQKKNIRLEANSKQQASPIKLKHEKGEFENDLDHRKQKQKDLKSFSKSKKQKPLQKGQRLLLQKQDEDVRKANTPQKQMQPLDLSKQKPTTVLSEEQLSQQVFEKMKISYPKEEKREESKAFENLSLQTSQYLKETVLKILQKSLHQQSSTCRHSILQIEQKIKQNLGPEEQESFLKLQHHLLMDQKIQPVFKKLRIQPQTQKFPLDLRTGVKTPVDQNVKFIPKESFQNIYSVPEPQQLQQLHQVQPKSLEQKLQPVSKERLNPSKIQQRMVVKSPPPLPKLEMVTELEEYGSIMHIDSHELVQLDQQQRRDLVLAVFHSFTDEYEQLVETAKSLFLSNISNPTYETGVNEDWAHQVAITCVLISYIARETNKRTDKHFLGAVMVSLIISCSINKGCKVLEDKLERSMLPLSVNEARDRKRKHKHEFRPTMHLITQLQIAMDSYNSVNTLLDCPYPPLQIQLFLNSCFIYKATLCARALDKDVSQFMTEFDFRPSQIAAYKSIGELVLVEDFD